MTNTGYYNTATGDSVLFNNTTGAFNSASGYRALLENTTGDANTPSGYYALDSNTIGDRNIALGSNAGSNIISTSDNICIGNEGVLGDSGVIRIGTSGTQVETFLAGNVGIGTNDPSSKLHVGGDGVSPSLRIQVSGATKLLVATNGGTSVGANETAPPANGLYVSGRVGTGTPTPGYPLEVTGSAARVDTYRYFGFGDSALVLSSAGATANTSIKASNEIVASHFSAFSDERIKDILGRSDGAADLDTLLGIEITDYRYKDPVEKGRRSQKKVIAQQVEEIFPQAVSTITDVVPDIFKKAPIKDGWVELATDLKVGERVRLITEGGHRAVHEVLEVGKDRFRTDFTEEAGQVFVYGREVADFRSVDYEAIPGRTYRLMESGDLATAFSEVGNFTVPGTEIDKAVQDSGAPAGRNFYRIEIENP